MRRRRNLLVLLAVLAVLLGGCAHTAGTGALDWAQLLPEPAVQVEQAAQTETAVSAAAEAAPAAPTQTAPDHPATAAAPAASAAAPAAAAKAPAVQPQCTISVSCATILSHLEQLDQAKHSLVPADGWILPALTVSVTEGESVFDVLQRVLRERKIHLEYTDTPLYDSAYIEGINNLYEFDVGELSGWMYRVNGIFPNYGCSRYQVQDGDLIEWVYTCDLGADVGGGAAAGGADE